MYSNANAVFRADITNALVEEAAGWDLNTIGVNIAPVVSVDADSGLYPKFKIGAGNLLRNEVAARAPYGAFPRGTQAFDQDTYATQEYGYEQMVDDKIATRMGRFFDAEMVAGRNAARKLKLAHEVRVAAMTFNTTNYGSATNSDTAYTIANIATFDAGLDIEKSLARLRAKGESTRNAVAVMSDNVFVRLKASTKMQNRLRGIGVASDTILGVSEQAMAEALGLKAVYVGRAVYDSAKEGASASTAAIWSDTYIWVGSVGPGGGYDALFNGGAQYTIHFAQNGAAFDLSTYRDEFHKSDIVRASHDVAEKVVNGNAGDLIASQYS